MLKAHSLIDKVYNWDNLWVAWRRVRRNKGAHGLDRVTIRAYEKDVETHLRELQRKLMEDRFVPHLVRRVYIPKASNPKQMRPLGIPTVSAYCTSYNTVLESSRLSFRILEERRTHTSSSCSFSAPSVIQYGEPALSLRASISPRSIQ